MLEVYSNECLAVTDLSEVFTDLVRAEIRLYNGLEGRMRAAHGISLGNFEFMRLIDERDRVRVNDIAQSIAITVGAVSKGVDRLEGAGWVRREPNPENRRSSLLVLTDEGTALLAAARVTYRAGLRDLLGEKLDPASMAHLASSLAELRERLESAGVGLPTG